MTIQVFRPRTPPEALDLVSRLLEYTPSSRITPMEACAHAFFNELRQPGTRMPNGREFPPLYNFTPQGIGGVYTCMYVNHISLLKFGTIIRQLAQFLEANVKHSSCIHNE